MFKRGRVTKTVMLKIGDLTDLGGTRLVSVGIYDLRH